jgi:hypothetical protein
MEFGTVDFDIYEPAAVSCIAGGVVDQALAIGLPRDKAKSNEFLSSLDVSWFSSVDQA